MARSGGAWSVKGIDQATRDIAKRAAQASGLTIGEWIDRAILEDARAKGVPVPHGANDGSAGVSAGPAVGGPASGGGSGSGTRPGGISQAALETLYKRLEQSDSRIDAALRPIAYTLHDIATRLVDAEKAAGSGSGTRDVPELASQSPELANQDEEPKALGELGPDSLPTAPPESWSPEPPVFEGPSFESQDLESQGFKSQDFEDVQAGEAEPESAPESYSENPLDRLGARPRNRPISRPVPHPPKGDFPADLSAADFGRPRNEDAAAEEPVAAPAIPSFSPVEPDHPRQAHRPDPVPPSGDFVPESLEPGLPPPGTVTARIDTGRVLGGGAKPVLTAAPAHDAANDAPGSQTGSRPGHQSGRRVGVAASLAMALVLLIATLAGSWWFATGGRFEGTDRMMADLGDRLSEAGESVVESAEAIWHSVAELTVAQNDVPEAPSAQSQSVQSADTPRLVEPAPAQPVPSEPKPIDQAAPQTAPQAAPQAESVQPETPASETAPSEAAASGPATPEAPVPPAPVAAVPAPPVSPAPISVAPVPAAPVTSPPETPTEAPSEAPSTADSLQAFPTSGERAANEAGTEQVAVAPPPAPTAPTEALLAQARAGDARAQHELATLLIAGDPSQAENAANWFREAAIQGLPNAQYNLGVLYERGLGVREDETRALLWYHSAAEQGHPLAQYNLGVLYAAGRGVPLSYAEAAYWFEQAAARGVPAAAYNLGVLVEGGLGRTRDMEAARAWYEKARELGHVGAGQRLAGETPNSNGDGLLDRPQTTSDAIALGAEDVALIQQRLADLGLYDGAVDGIAGARTQAAISRYQAANGLPVTGLASAMLLKRLQ